MNAPSAPQGFGLILGVNAGVTSYSNGSSLFVGGQEEQTPTGIRWQCVEYARRWWQSQLGVVFSPVETADEIWRRPPLASLVSTGQTVPMELFKNGGKMPPARGDLVIYPTVVNSVKFSAGHVAVVVGVDEMARQVLLAEQNFSNQAWAEPTSHARSLQYQATPQAHRLIDTSAAILGWVRPNFARPKLASD